MVSPRGPANFRSDDRFSCRHCENFNVISGLTIIIMSMAITEKSLPNDLDAVKRIAVHYAKESDTLREELRLLRAQLYGRSSERFAESGPRATQLSLFDKENGDSASSGDSGNGGSGAGSSVKAHTRKKPGRRPLPDFLPRVPILHDINDAEKQCPCGARKHRIGQEVSEQLDIIPAVFRVLQHIRPKYACRSCDGLDQPAGHTIVVSPPYPQIIAKSIAAPSLLAHIFVGKFADALPFYRQETQFQRLGVEINRTTMCNWAIRVAGACEPLMEALCAEVLAGPHIHVDETPVRVLEAPGHGDAGECYEWVFCGGQPEKPAIVFKFALSREREVVENFLGGYQGGVQTDGYVAYHYLDTRPGVVHFGCLSHIRRKFVDVLKAASSATKGLRPINQKTRGVAEEVVEQLRLVFAVDASAREQRLSPEQIVAARQSEARPILEQIKGTLESKVDEVPRRSLLGKAIHYALGQWDRAVRYLDHGYARPDNNRVENAIRPFALGRKNWLFSKTEDGANASATLFSLIETAKANGIEPFSYLKCIFERIPLADGPAAFKALLPQYIDREEWKLSSFMPRLSRAP